MISSSSRLLDHARSLLRALRPMPTVPVDHEDADLHAKLGGAHVFGSIKDVPALWILAAAIERGEVGPQTTIVESSSGNFAIAIATACRLLGLRFIPVIDPTISPLNEAVLRASCERVHKVSEPDDSGGYLRTRLRVVRELCAELTPSYWTNQYGNPDAMWAHYNITGNDLCSSFERLDVAFVGVSSAGTIAGVSRRLKAHFPAVRVVAVDVEGSVIFGAPPARRRIPGIGASIVPTLLAQALVDEVSIVSEAASIAACRTLLTRHGLFVGGSSGSVFAAVSEYDFSRHAGRPTAVFLCPDRGNAYVDTVFRDPE